MLVFAEGLALGKESLPRVVLCRVPEHLPSTNPQALGKDALSGSANRAIDEATNTLLLLLAISSLFGWLVHIVAGLFM